MLVRRRWKNSVTILLSKDRLAKGIHVPTKIETFRTLIEIIHAALVQYERIDIWAVKMLLSEKGRDFKDSGFI